MDKIYTEYISENTKISTLSKRFKLSSKTLARAFAKLEVKKPENLALKEVVVLADASYYGDRCNFGVVAFKDAISGKFLWWKFIYKKEQISDYLQGLDYLRQKGYIIIAVVSDGLRGLSRAISPLPFQFCQFHAQSYAKTKLTNSPKTQAGINLLRIANSIFYTNSTEFRELLENFYSEFGDFLSEKTTNENGRSFYTHKRLRSAYFSLKRNLPLLFTYEKFSVVPNTNNKLEGSFKDLKNRLRVHNGLNLTNKERLISWYFFIKNNQK